jgi:hypothetical protein
MILTCFVVCMARITPAVHEALAALGVQAAPDSIAVVKTQKNTRVSGTAQGFSNFPLSRLFGSKNTNTLID